MTGKARSVSLGAFSGRPFAGLVVSSCFYLTAQFAQFFKIKNKELGAYKSLILLAVPSCPVRPVDFLVFEIFSSLAHLTHARAHARGKKTGQTGQTGQLFYFHIVKCAQFCGCPDQRTGRTGRDLCLSIWRDTRCSVRTRRPLRVRSTHQTEPIKEMISRGHSQG